MTLQLFAVDRGPFSSSFSSVAPSSNTPPVPPSYSSTAIANPSRPSGQHISGQPVSVGPLQSGPQSRVATMVRCPAPPYTLNDHSQLTRIYPYSLRYTVMFTSVFGFIWALAEGVISLINRGDSLGKRLPLYLPLPYLRACLFSAICQSKDTKDT